MKVCLDVSARRRILAVFIRFLKDRLGYVFNVKEEFDKRFLLQKYVFLAKYFGLDLEYDYSLYIYGPYSRELADDYYELACLETLPKTDLPSRFDAEGFIELVRGRDAMWLEVAASILTVLEKYPDLPEEEIYNILRMSKPWLTREYFKEVHKVLREKRLI
ncbi:MAG: hypothetical protein NDP13_06660 [Crenarchaeota archaeon]|nr:hypothetical protein [Thermoproteota archaeon]MCR8455997.1 hypothetical protein [Thermoproteota archaeon]